MMKMINISFKSSFRSQDIYAFVFALQDDRRLILKFYDVINCLNKNFMLYLVAWHRNLSIDRANAIWKTHAENVPQKLVPEPFSILANNPKQSLHARNSFKNMTFSERIIKKP